MRQPMTTPDAWVVLWETWCHMPPEDCAQLWGCLPPWAQRRLGAIKKLFPALVWPLMGQVSDQDGDASYSSTEDR
jgi:hypothetical protein